MLLLFVTCEPYPNHFVDFFPVIKIYQTKFTTTTILLLRPKKIDTKYLLNVLRLSQ